MDQTIEKVSFCAPDRNYDKAFSYICRDGTTRRWMCHCFMALKDSVRGPRLSFLCPSSGILAFLIVISWPQKEVLSAVPVMVPRRRVSRFANLRLRSRRFSV